MGIGRFGYTPLLPLMRQDGLLSISEGGLLASVHYLGYLLGAVIATRIPLSPRTVFRLSLLSIALTTMAMAMTDNFSIWLILRFWCGACSAWVLVLIANYYLKYLASTGRETLQGWVFSGVGAGIAIAGLGVLAMTVSHIGSASGWMIFGVISLVIVLPICINIGPEISAARSAPGNPKRRRAALISRPVIAYGAAGLGYVIPATFLPIMAREFAQSPVIFGWSWPVFGMSAFLSTLLAAKFQQLFSNRQIWVTSQVIMAFGLLLPVIYPHLLSIIIAGICVGGTFMIITMVGLREAHRTAHPDQVTGVIAVMTAAFATGQIIGPIFGSLVYDLTQSFSAALVLTSITLVVTAITLMKLPNGKPRGTLQS